MSATPEREGVLRDEGRLREPRLGAFVTVGLTLAAWVICARRIPLLQALPWWWWEYGTRPLPGAALFLQLLLLVAALAYVSGRRTLRARFLLPLLLAGGFVLQFGFAWMEGRGIEALRHRTVHSGHSVFVIQAVQPSPTPAEVASRYYWLIRHKKLTFYPNATKPPGQLLTYMGLEHLSRVVPVLRGMEALERLKLFATCVCPALTYLVLIPLFLLGRLLLDRERIHVPALLFLCIPGVNLITLHMDQCLYPLLFVLPLLFFVASVETDRPWLALPVGPLVYLATFVSFSLVPVLAVLAGYGMLAVLLRRGAPDTRPGFTVLKAAALALLGLLATHLLVRALFDYDALYGYRFAMRSHQNWKIRDWTLGQRIYSGLLDSLEFFWWVGIPVTALALLHLIRACRRIRSGTWSGVDALALSTAATLCLMALLGKTMAETARLWLFLVPLLALFAGAELSLRLRKNQPLVLYAVLFLELGTTFVFKLYQDFH